MSCVWIDRELNVAAAFPKRADQFFRNCQGNGVILGTMKRPNRRVFQDTHPLRESMKPIAATTDRRHGGKPLGPGGRQIPGAKAAHAQAGEIEAVRVDRVLSGALIQQVSQTVGQFRPPGIPGAQRGNDNERKVTVLGNVTRQPVAEESNGISPDSPRPWRNRIVGQRWLMLTCVDGGTCNR